MHFASYSPLFLGMIYLAIEISRQHSFALGLGSVHAHTLKRDKHRVDFAQDLWVGEIERPALLTFVVVEQNAESLHLALVAVSFSPSGIDELAVVYTARG